MIYIITADCLPSVYTLHSLAEGLLLPAGYRAAILLILRTFGVIRDSNPTVFYTDFSLFCIYNCIY